MEDGGLRGRKEELGTGDPADYQVLYCSNGKRVAVCTRILLDEVSGSSLLRYKGVEQIVKSVGCRLCLEWRGLRNGPIVEEVLDRKLRLELV